MRKHENNALYIIFWSQYLGSYTSEKVKTRCIEMMFTWSSALQHEPKVREAYSMLKKQGIVKSDPVLKDVPVSDGSFYVCVRRRK